MGGRAPFRGEGVDDLEFMQVGICVDAVAKSMRFFPVPGLDDHFPVIQVPEDQSFFRFFVGVAVFDLHQ